ncbi:hypothetical protein ABT218_07500 [Streptomyces sp. NPDC001455]|uniref:hypothetical protein n=1 Tax=Streptomyces sp. NPDC001455 TaxID=3154518 RepID=UPI003320F400
MPSPYDHLTTAEELLHKARRLLEEGRTRTATGHAQLASAFLEAASARERIIPEPAPVPTARLGPLPEWCGNCDGPDLSLRWIQVTLPDEEPVRMAKCPACNPAAPQYSASLSDNGTATDGSPDSEAHPSPSGGAPADTGARPG